MSSNFKQTNRILSLDVFRGITMVLMILVNSQGTRLPYPLLEHAAWNGCTLADLVFPFFLFIVGQSLAVSLKKQREVRGRDKLQLYYSIVQRSFILFALGLFLNAFPHHFDFATIRVYGILQRIALCYLICSFIYLNTDARMQVLIFLALLWVYWFIMTIIPVPGYGTNQLSEKENWVAYIDQMLFSANHLFGTVYDPEGFLSTIPSIATTLSGAFAGSLLVTQRSNFRKTFILLCTGIIFLFLGFLWSFSFPINKNLWTSSFVLWSSGYALILFALCFLIIDIWGYKYWTFPFKVMGMNALVIFVVHVILLKMQSVFHFPLANGSSESLRVLITDYLFGSYSPQNAALFYAILFLILIFFLALYLYRQKLFIRI